jgi:hypothetical protein
MHIQARRVFRLAFTVAISLMLAYAISMPLPFIAPIFAVVLTIKPAPPMGPKSLLGLIVLLVLTSGIGLLLIPLLLHYSFTAILVVTLGLYASFYLTINHGKVLVGMFLTLGFTLISAAGTVSFSLATTLIESLATGIAVAVISHWLVYPLYPEDHVATDKPADTDESTAMQDNWIALRGTIVILPVYILLLINPLMYLPIMMKGVSLAQQSSTMKANEAGRELVGSTFLGGCFAILLWMALGIFTHLWMYFFWMLLFGIYFSSKIYQLIKTRYPASFWLNVVITTLILLGPAVEDSNSGKDVYTAFFIRISLMVAVTLYAVAAVYIMEYLRSRHLFKRSTPPAMMKST